MWGSVGRQFHPRLFPSDFLLFSLFMNSLSSHFAYSFIILFYIFKIYLMFYSYYRIYCSRALLTCVFAFFMQRVILFLVLLSALVLFAAAAALLV